MYANKGGIKQKGANKTYGIQLMCLPVGIASHNNQYEYGDETSIFWSRCRQANLTFSAETSGDIRTEDSLVSVSEVSSDLAESAAGENVGTFGVFLRGKRPTF